MNRRFIQAGTNVLASLVLVSQMTACGSGGASGNASSAASDVVIGGSVGDGPITGATVTIYNASGEELSSVTSDIYATYSSKIKIRKSDYPLVMEVVGGIDLVTGAAPDFTLYSVAGSRKEKNVNINPFSTLAVKIARLMPDGVNPENIEVARNYVASQLGFGLDENVIGNPITASINDDNVANIVKASEAMGEMIRRTRDTLSINGAAITGDDVMGAIAADMVDGHMDGAGAEGTNPEISAVANVVSGQVLIEAVSNSLKVGGVVATDLIDQAIQLTRLNINSDQLTGNVRITDNMLQQAQVGLAAARMVDSSDQVIAIVNSLKGVSANSLPGEVASELPADSSTALDNAVILSSTANEVETASINQAVYADGTASDTGSSGSTGSGSTDTGNTGDTGSGSAGGNDPGGTDGGTTGGSDTGGTDTGNTGSTGGGASEPVNNRPVISGTPAASVSANYNYSFQPNAADADGNVLAFSIANKPGWASFSDTTGRLDGTPADGDTGSYNNIVIAVTDGLDTANLPAFSIRVDAAPVPTGSFALSWTAPVARSDGSPLSLAEIDGYRIYYGSAPGSYPNSMNVTDGSAQSVTVTKVPAGDYRVVMTTVDDSGRESANSAEITKTAQ